MKKINKILDAMSRTQMLAIVLLTSIILVSIIGTSYAAYVSRSYVKGVAASPKQAINMSSDYLNVISNSTVEANFPVRRIVLEKKSNTDDNPYIINFYIDNTNGSEVSSKRIEYYIKINGLPEGVKIKLEGSELTGTDYDSITNTELKYKAAPMPAFTKTTHNYSIEIPKNMIDSVTDIVVIAVPTAESDSSGNVLATRIQPSTIGTVATFSYQGAFPDKTDGNHPYDFAAFNYEISVTSATNDHTMIITWDNEKLEIDPDFIRMVSGSVSNPGTLEITMNSENNHYLIKFYRLIGRNESDEWQQSWTSMERIVSFSEK